MVDTEDYKWNKEGSSYIPSLSEGSIDTSQVDQEQKPHIIDIGNIASKNRSQNISEALPDSIHSTIYVFKGKQFGDDQESLSKDETQDMDNIGVIESIEPEFESVNGITPIKKRKKISEERFLNGAENNYTEIEVTNDVEITNVQKINLKGLSEKERKKLLMVSTSDGMFDDNKVTVSDVLESPDLSDNGDISDSQLFSLFVYDAEESAHNLNSKIIDLKVVSNGCTIVDHKETKRLHSFYNELRAQTKWEIIEQSDEIQTDFYNNDNDIQLNTECDFYGLFLNESLLKDISTATNNYANKKIHTLKPDGKSILLNWENTTSSEIKKFIGILLYMGLVPLRRMEDYWSKDQFFGVFKIAEFMKRDRFLLILSNIHFCPEVTKNGKVKKIYALIEKVNTLFNEFAIVTENLVVDESLIPFKGRLSFLQYNPSKSAKRGVKLFRLSCVDGYVLKTHMYEGKDMEFKKSELYSSYIVNKLIKGYENKWHTLYLDNYFTGINLAETLKKSGIHIVGTLRKNRREIPKFFCSVDLKRGELIGLKNKEDIRIFKWKSKRDVMILSTKHNLEVVEKKTFKKESYLVPRVIDDYNKNKIGVDLGDQLNSYSSHLRKSLKWYRKVAFDLLLGTMVTNSFLLYKKFNVDSKIKLLEYRKMIIKNIWKQGSITWHILEEITFLIYNK